MTQCRSIRKRFGAVSQQDCESFLRETSSAALVVPTLKTADAVVQLGNTFGKLTVLLFGKNKWGQTTVMCSCACGGKANPTISALASGYTKSCGCLRLSQDFSDKRVVASVLTTYKARAKQRGLEFALDHHTVRTLILAQCFYCGTIPYREWRIVTKGGVTGLKCNGIDRVNNELGYAATNVVPRCPRCNYAKRDMDIKEFSTWAIRLATHLQKQGVSVVDSSAVETTTTNKKDSN